MTGNEILQADFLDILFDNRNKKYGAYTLRKHYNNRLGLALAISFSFIFLVFLFLKPDQSAGLKENEDEFIVKTVLIPPIHNNPEPTELPKVNPPSQSVSQQEFLPNIEIIKDHIKYIDPMPPVSDIINMSTGYVNETEGNYHPTVIGMGIGKDEPINQKPETQDLLIQKEPEFPGGAQALLNFLTRNLRVPDEMEAGEKKKVLIRFQVGNDGSVTGFEILQSAGNTFDNEVIRVLKKMPKWKPAIQNNLPVSRSFTQPVIFMGVED